MTDDYDLTDEDRQAIREYFASVGPLGFTSDPGFPDHGRPGEL